MLRLAFVGKGGSGKSSIAGTFARLLARRGEPVLVVDSDPMPGLAISLGIEPSDEGIPDEAVEEGPEDGPRFQLRDGLTAEEAVERYAFAGPDGVRLLQLGKLHGHAGALVRSQFAFRQVVDRLPEGRWHVVGDLPGGTRQPYFGWGRYADTYLIVVEPMDKSLLAARRLTGLSDAWSEDGGPAPRVLAVANKVRAATDRARIADRLDVPVVAEVPWDEDLHAAESRGQAPVDSAPASAAVRAVGSLVEQLCGEAEP